MRKMIAHEIAASPAQVTIYRGIEGGLGITRTIDIFENDKAVVAAGHPQPPPQRRSYRGAARAFGLAVSPKKTVEMFVVPNLVFDDAARQQRQHRLGAGARQGRVITGRTH